MFVFCHSKLAYSISFFSDVPALTNSRDYAPISCNRTKIQQMLIFVINRSIDLKAKNRRSHIFFRCHPKLVCSISFFSYVPALTNGLDYATILCNRSKIQKTPIFSTVVEKLIDTLTNLTCTTVFLCYGAPERKMLLLRPPINRSSPTKTVFLTFCLDSRKNSFWLLTFFACASAQALLGLDKHVN